MVDLNIYGAGETALPLDLLVQQIDILLQANHQTVITNYQPENDLDQYLFRNGVNANTVASQLQDNIMENCDVPDGYTVHVEANFLSTLGAKDLLYIEIQIYCGTTSVQQLSYALN